MYRGRVCRTNYLANRSMNNLCENKLEACEQQLELLFDTYVALQCWHMCICVVVTIMEHVYILSLINNRVFPMGL
jgi:hypothetical protein